ncbi:uncharacterized protein LOC124818305 isoform X2 [Hydra vulgaris]
MTQDFFRCQQFKLKLSRVVGENWRNLGFWLKINETFLKAIDEDYSKTNDKAYEMLKKWMQLEPTLEDLRAALCSMERMDLVRQVDELINNQLSFSMGNRHESTLNDKKHIPEIVINKKCDNVSVAIYTHNTYGGDKLTQGNYAVLNTALQKRTEESGLQITSITTQPSTFTNARQAMADDTSCYEIVADELKNGITISSFDIPSPYPQCAEQLGFSHLTFLHENFGDEDWVYHLFKEKETLKNSDIDLEDTSALPIQEIPVLTIVQTREKVQQTVSSKDVAETNKIAQLKKIEEEHYKPFIRELAYKKTQEELKDLIIVLTDLGYLNTKLGELIGELKYYTNAAVFYQYVITIQDEKLSVESKNVFSKQELAHPYQQLSYLQELIFSEIGGDKEKMAVFQNEVKSNKKLLLTMRKKTDQEMQEIESYYQKARIGNQEEKQKYQVLYVNAARELFEKIADKMKDFLAKLFKKAEAMLSKPPCKYAVIGLGSMSLKQMTPYSDLEFAIITENKDYKRSDDIKIKDYFKNLTHLVNFKIINLGESIIPTSKYGLDMSHLVHRGVNFDLGGKTPLGRVEGDKPYELIRTVDDMLWYVYNKADHASHIDKNLPYILENICYVHGDKKLVKTYLCKVTKFLHSKNEDDEQGRLNCEIRAINVLKKGSVEVDYLTLDMKAKKTHGDLDRLQPELFLSEGRLFDVKQEIYRLPDRLMYNLGLYYGIRGDSGWDTVDKLEEQGIINRQAAVYLRNVITFATILRLKTYSYHKAQKEDMSIFVRPAETASEIKEQIKYIFHLSEADLEEEGRLFQYFYTALPLYRRLEEFCTQYQVLSKESRQTFFKESNFYEDNTANKGFIHYRLAQYKDAQSNLEVGLDDLNNQCDLQERLTLGLIYNKFGKNNQAIEQYEFCLNILKLTYQDKLHPDVVACLINLGNAYEAKGDYKQAIKYYKESLKINKLIYQDKAHPYVAMSFNNLGCIYNNKGHYEQAIRYYKDCLKMNKLIYQDQPHPDVANSFNNVGNAYYENGQYEQAMKYYEESLKMNKIIYQDEPHPFIATSFNNLGNVYNDKGQYEQAIKYYEESLNIEQLIFKDKLNPSVASLFNNLGIAYNEKGQFQKAIRYYEDCLRMRKCFYQDQPHPDVATTLNNLGNVYYDNGQYKQAIKYYAESLKMNKLIYQDRPHPDVATSFNNLGSTYIAKGQYEKAIRYHKESLKMRILIYHDKLHPDIAIALNNLGISYNAKGKYEQAIKYFENSLKINKFIYQDEPHPDVAASLQSLGFAFYFKGNYEQSIKYHNESLTMKKLIFQNESHPLVADSFNNLGSAYRAKGQNKQAVKYFKESLKLKKLIYQDVPHPSVAASFNNLGVVSKDKGQYDQAITYYEESLKINKLVYQEKPHPDLATTFNNLGRVYDAKG